MSSSLRNDNNEFYISTGLTANEQSEAVKIGGCRGYSIFAQLTDNGAGAGNVSIRASLDGLRWVEVPSSEQTIAFVGGTQMMLFNIIDPMYKYIDLDVSVSAGDIDISAEITIIEGGM